MGQDSSSGKVIEFDPSSKTIPRLNHSDTPYVPVTFRPDLKTTAAILQKPRISRLVALLGTSAVTDLIDVILEDSGWVPQHLLCDEPIETAAEKTARFIQQALS